MGWQWLPRIGQEVLVRFADGDIDQPIVIGTLYNGRGEGGTAPTPGGETRGEADISVFDDTDSQLRVQLHASTGHSQLNLGHLIHQQENHRGSFRGQGLELRTDAYGALRGGKGVLLATYHGPTGNKLEPTGDFAAGMALMKQVSQLGQALSDAAKTHLTVQIAGHIGATKLGQSILDKDRAPYPAMQHAVSGTVAGQALQDAYADAADKHIAPGQDKVPHSTDPVVAIAAKAGLAMVAGQHLQMVAGETVTLATAGDINLVLADALRIHTGQAIRRNDRMR